MKKSQLLFLIKEVVDETMSEYNDAWDQFPSLEPEVKPSGTSVTENDVVGFEKQILNRLLKLPKYKNNLAAAKRASIQISQLAKSGDKRATDLHAAWRQESKRANESLGISALDQAGDAIGNDPNDPLAKKLSVSKEKETKSTNDIRKVDGIQANRDKQNFSKIKDEERRKQKAQTDLAKAAKDSQAAEEAMTKKVNKI